MDPTWRHFWGQTKEGIEHLLDRGAWDQLISSAARHILQNTHCNFLFIGFILWIHQLSHWTCTMKAVHRHLRFIPYCSEDFALADKKLFSMLRYMACTTADTCKAFTELRNNIFKNIFAWVLKAASWYRKQGKCVYKQIQLPFYLLMKMHF